MSTIPPAPPASTPDDAPLNPAMKKVRDGTYGPDQEGTDPMDTVSVQKEEGVWWPAIWAVTTIVCVIVAIVLIFF